MLLGERESLRAAFGHSRIPPVILSKIPSLSGRSPPRADDEGSGVVSSSPVAPWQVDT